MAARVEAAVSLVVWVVSVLCYEEHAVDGKLAVLPVVRGRPGARAAPLQRQRTPDAGVDLDTVLPRRVHPDVAPVKLVHVQGHDVHPGLDHALLGGEPGQEFRDDQIGVRFREVGRDDRGDLLPTVHGALQSGVGTIMYLPRPTVYRLPIGGSCSELRGRMPAEGRYTALLKAKLGRRSGKVPRSLNSLAPAFHPRRLAARSLLDGSFSLGCVEFCRISGDFIAEDGELVRHSCNTYATVMQHSCNAYATPTAPVGDSRIEYEAGRPRRLWVWGRSLA